MNLPTASAICLSLLLAAVPRSAAKDYTIFSPDKKIKMQIAAGGTIEFSVLNNQRVLVQPSTISMTLGDGTVLGHDATISDAQRQTVRDTVFPIVKRKSAAIVEAYNELRLTFRGNYALACRVFDNGVAYRFETAFPGEVTVKSEEVSFNFEPADTVFFPQEESLMSHNERLYRKLALGQAKPDSFCSLPALVKKPDGTDIVITESDLRDYPGLWLKVNEHRTFSGLLPGVALKEEQTNDRDVRVTKYADYIARTKGTRTFPWRVMAIARTDADLLLNQMVFLLAEPSRLEDVSWIRPGKVAWDWWNALNVWGVNFRAGINTATYKYYIDFASRQGIEYVILDEGWYKLGDLTAVDPDIDIHALVQYAKERNVGIILWAIWKTLDNQLETALNLFQEWGVRGIKVDFMQRDDQAVVNFYERVAREAARRKMLVDFHGSFKPTGLERTYPNVITREGVRGLEHVKWSPLWIPGHEVTLPFIRMVAGPMDYTPGAMTNAQRDDFRPIFTRPMSMGTRCHQLAMYVVYESPLQMLADAPSNYLREPECLEFLSKVPTVWDETVPLEGKVGEEIVIARRSNEEWFVGAMGGEEPRDVSIDLSFLGPAAYTLDAWEDGINADRYGSDYRKATSTVTAGEKIRVHLAPGGGWAARIHPK